MTSTFRPIRGSIPALVTPMREDGAVDYAALRRLIDWHIAEGTDCISVVGTTGESPTVTVEEHCEIIRVTVEQAAGRVPAQLGLHQLAGDHDDFALTLAPFRAAGFATLTIDLPAHGANFSGPRLQPDDELVALAALETLAGRPEVDPDRLGVIGGSLGAFFALRTAAAAPGAGVRLKACVAYASPFDIGQGIPDAVPGIRENFAWVVGARTYAETLALGRPFHLRTGLQRITCPLLLVHGQQDHICDFTAPYEIARRVTAPLTIVPLPGVDHEAAVPSAPHLAGPGIAWLKAHL